MDVIIFESQAFREIDGKLTTILRKVSEQKSYQGETWLDNQEVCKILKISKRTLQSYRDEGILPFSQVGSKIYYKRSDIDKKLLALRVLLKDLKRIMRP